MRYRIRYTSAAREDLLNAAAWWSEHRSAEQAARWFLQVEKGVESLKANPDRCAAAPETSLLDGGIRQLNVGIGGHSTHRILFTIQDDAVVILRIRHSSQDTLDEVDLP